METRSYLRLSQAPDTSPYPEPDQSIHASPPHVFKIHFNIIPNLHLRLPSGLSTSNPVKTSPVPIRATCAAHIIEQNNYPAKGSCSVINFVAEDVLPHSVNSEADKGCQLPNM